MNNPLESNGVCDSRDLIEYRDFLEEELVDYYNEYLDDHNMNVEDDEQMEHIETFGEVDTALEGFYDRFNTEIEHFEAIEKFISECDYGDFRYGEAIIGRDYFEEYCEEFVKDCGYLPNDIPGFLEVAIDWEKVADQLEMDYTTVNFENDEYLIRA